MKEWSKTFRNIILLSQLGLSLLMPLLLCVGFCWWLQDRFALGAWIFIPGFIMGLGSSGMTGWKFFNAILKKEGCTKERKDPPISFNQH